MEYCTIIIYSRLLWVLASVILVIIGPLILLYVYATGLTILLFVVYQNWINFLRKEHGTKHWFFCCLLELDKFLVKGARHQVALLQCKSTDTCECYKRKIATHECMCVNLCFLYKLTNYIYIFYSCVYDYDRLTSKHTIEVAPYNIVSIQMC